MTRVVMTNHMNKVGHKVQLQEEGGHAGLRLTGTLARNAMAKWRRMILEMFSN